MLIECLEDCKSVMRLYELSTGKEITQIPMEIGSVGSLSCKRESTELFYSFTSFLTPSTIYHCDLSDVSNVSPTVFRQTVVAGFDPADYETRQVFYTSKDGTQVPMFIVAPNGVKLDASSSCLLYGYGGFNISLTPSFSSTRLPWLSKFKGIFCIANIRGGGEYGQEWHDGGIKANKQNSYDDFIAAGEYLVEQQYTTKEKLAILGGSNGGLLVGACLNQRPDLFSAGVAACGVMDALRFQRYTIGHAWTSDFGSSDNKEDFERLLKISPTHNIPNSEDFPAVLVTTADHDDRVVPHHSLKYLAMLQQTVTKGSRPLLGRIDTKAGHGFGKSTEMV